MAMLKGPARVIEMEARAICREMSDIPIHGFDRPGKSRGVELVITRPIFARASGHDPHWVRCLVYFTSRLVISTEWNNGILTGEKLGSVH